MDVFLSVDHILSVTKRKQEERKKKKKQGEAAAKNARPAKRVTELLQG